MRIRNRREMVLALAGGGAAAVLAACSNAASTPAKEAPKAAAVSDKLFLSVDVVQGSKNLTGDAAKLRSCVLSSRFPRNGEMVFRARVFDPKTGDLMDDKALKSVEVQLSNGRTLQAAYGAHPKDPPNEFFWTTSWVIPKDHPTGTLKYGVTATAADGRTGKFEPMATQPSLPAIIEEVLPDAAPAKA
jgi:hypothetical protein